MNARTGLLVLALVIVGCGQPPATPTTTTVMSGTAPTVVSTVDQGMVPDVPDVPETTTTASATTSAERFRPGPRCPSSVTSPKGQDGSTWSRFTHRRRGHAELWSRSRKGRSSGLLSGHLGEVRLDYLCPSSLLNLLVGCLLLWLVGSGGG